LILTLKAIWRAAGAVQLLPLLLLLGRLLLLLL
jgi:hypothetical protein